MQKIIKQLQDKAIEHFYKTDPVIYKVVKRIGPLKWHFSDNYFIELVESVVSQQLSIKAADTIFSRLKALSVDPELTAGAILRMKPEKMRNAGLSWSKVSYIKNIAEYTLTSEKVFEQFPKMSDERIITELTKIKGVGRWTAEMFLIFTLGRPDVFSYADLGLRRAIQRLYHFKSEPTQEKTDKISGKWKPFRSIASRYLWKSLAL